MSVATKNPFAILDADDASRPPSPGPAPNSASKAPPPPTQGTQKSRGPASRGGKYYPRGGAKPNSRDSNQPHAEEPVTDDQRKAEGASRGGRGRGRGAGRGGRRPFDRHSQTGKIDSDKKMHQGWGGDQGNSELKAEEAAANDAAAEAVPDWTADADASQWGPSDTAASQWGSGEATASKWTPAETTESATAPQPEDRPRRDREQEEEDTTLTLDQYYAQQKEKDLVLPKTETRQPNEGAGANLWDDVVHREPPAEQDYFPGKAKSTPKARAKKEEKIFIEINAQFEQPGRRGRGRGDRARGRGRGGPRGGPRGGFSQNGGAVSDLNVDDQTAFPSLA